MFLKKEFANYGEVRQSAYNLIALEGGTVWIAKEDVISTLWFERGEGAKWLLQGKVLVQEANSWENVKCDSGA